MVRSRSEPAGSRAVPGEAIAADSLEPIGPTLNTRGHEHGPRSDRGGGGGGTKPRCTPSDHSGSGERDRLTGPSWRFGYRDLLLAKNARFTRSGREVTSRKSSSGFDRCFMRTLGIAFGRIRAGGARGRDDARSDRSAALVRGLILARPGRVPALEGESQKARNSLDKGLRCDRHGACCHICWRREVDALPPFFAFSSTPQRVSGPQVVRRGEG